MSSQTGQLAQLDPGLVVQYRATLEPLQKTNPEAAKHLMDFVGHVLDQSNPSATTRPDATHPAEFGLAFQTLPENVRLDLNVSIQVEQLVAHVQASHISITQQSIDIEVQISTQHVDPLVLTIDGAGRLVSARQRT